MGLKRELGAAVQRTLDRHLRIGVTGLARAGKTAFITSLVNQLHHVGAHLEFFGAAREGRVLGARQLSQTRLEIPTFPYPKALAALQDDPPDWPEPTRGVSELRLAIRFRPRRSPLRYLGEVATLHLDIVDYPGEWLLDLPLLTLSYTEWSRRVRQWYDTERRQLAAEWLDGLASLDWRAPANDAQLARLAEQYTDSLHAARSRGLSYIQPGRFVMPGELAGAPVLQFFPALSLDDNALSQLAGAPANSVFRTLERRFDYYRRHVARAFYRDHFARLDRQIVLVDCLAPLSHGASAVRDAQLTLGEILSNFRYGQRDILRRLFAPRIDRLVFAATKADHITADQQPRLAALLGDLLGEADRTPRFESVPVETLCIASVRASEQVEVSTRAGYHPALRGVLANGELATFYPGDVPDRIPDPQLWQRHQFAFQTLQPPRTPPRTPLPHLRMDVVLDHLLGDKLR